MPEFRIVLVEPKIEGNVGAVARVMANFGLRDLILVNPCSVGDEAYRRAKHGRSILADCETARTLAEALGGAGLAVGTTGISTTNERAYHRHALTPRRAREKLSEFGGKVALVFGREDYGLLNAELARIDLLVHIPCRSPYPVMNLSHAAAILFYELSGAGDETLGPGTELASGLEREKLVEAFQELLETTGYPRHKRRKTQVMFRRLMGRSLATRPEFHAFMGALRRASKAFRRLSESPVSGPSS